MPISRVVSKHRQPGDGAEERRKLERRALGDHERQQDEAQAATTWSAISRLTCMSCQIR